MQIIQSQKSLARWFRQLFYFDFKANWLDQKIKETLKKRIEESELGHRGEIYLIIENTLPLTSAYQQACRERALELFATHNVWDTEENTGILIYINLCEKDLEIIADRGINQKVAQEHWQSLCQETLEYFKKDEMLTGIETLVIALGVLLKTHFPFDDPHGNELDNTPVHLR